MCCLCLILYLLLQLCPTRFKSIAMGEAPKSWKDAIDSVLPAIVVIRTCSTEPFDGLDSSCAEATGFVVDKARGLILTNRHVVQTGPLTADAVFCNKEEIDLRVVYRVSKNTQIL